MADKTFILKCDGLDESLEFSFWEDDCIILEHSIMSFYAYQRPIRDYFTRMFKMIWCALSGKEYNFFEIVIDKEKLEEFKKFVAGL